MRAFYNKFSNDLPNYIQNALRDFSQKFQTCIPAIVKEVKSRDTVVVSPAVLQTASDGSAVDWSDITTTILTPFSGAMFISMPVAVGDTGWLVGADLDTDKFKESKQPEQQTVFTRHQYQFGFFVPDAINGYTVSEDDEGAIVLSSLDGQTKIAIKDGSIELTSKTDLKINAQNVSINSDGSNVIIDGINWLTHTHGIGTEPNGTLVADLTNGTVKGITGTVTPGV